MGILYLGILSYQDVFKKRIVDDRFNYMMMGATVPLYFLFHASFLYILTLLALSVGLSYGLRKLKVIGDGDTKTIVWSFMGWGVLGLPLLITYILIFVGLYLFNVACLFTLNKCLKNFHKDRFKFPLFPTFWMSFVVVVVLAVFS